MIGSKKLKQKFEREYYLALERHLAEKHSIDVDNLAIFENLGISKKAILEIEEKLPIERVLFILMKCISKPLQEIISIERRAIHLKDFVCMNTIIQDISSKYECKPSDLWGEYDLFRKIARSYTTLKRNNSN